MTTFFRKYSTPILILSLLTLLVLAWLFPSRGLILGIMFLLLSLVIASLAVFEKHQEAFRRGQITRGVFIRDGALEMLGILFAMLLAGLLGRYVAEIATRPIDNSLIRTIAGILVGLLVGMGTGAVARKTWGRLAKVSFQRWG